MTNNSQQITGNIRLQFLSKTLLRIEIKGPRGFEDRPTFTVLERAFSEIERSDTPGDPYIIHIADGYQVYITNGGQELSDIQIESLDGVQLFSGGEYVPALANLPTPSESLQSWAFADNPRIIPPKWGATPAPGDSVEYPTSGWDVGSDAPDIYIFIPGNGSYTQFRSDFLNLTGRIPIPPLYMFGLIDSRYHPYTDTAALRVIDTYRRKEIPLDVFVMDTDWRVGASHGYEINTELIPDMEGFLQGAHNRNVSVMFNDHPEPHAAPALGRAEIKYRYDNLTKLLALGADLWWYDRNWVTHIEPPVPGFTRDVWGQRLYRDITYRFNSELRPIIMSNVAGIEHGFRAFPPHPAEHRFPVWWTGDTAARWDYLRVGIENCVDYGIIGLMPYVHEDLGGHFGDPSPELFVRFVQFGVFSPITRLHCTHGEKRYPWSFGEQAERIVIDYIQMRYRLLPTIYSAASRAYEDGIPIVRRCDLLWPEYPESRDNTQYMFTDDILVAPIVTGEGDYFRIPAENHAHDDGVPGLEAKYYDGLLIEGEPQKECIEPVIDFDWGWSRLPDGLTKTAFSAAWEGMLVNPPQSGLYEFGLYLSGCAKIWLDDDLILDVKESNILEAKTSEITLLSERSYRLRVEFIKTEVRAYISLVWMIKSPVKIPERRLWLPPGRWMDAWSGARISGPKHIHVRSELWHTPIYIREGSLIFTIPQIQYSDESAWKDVVIEAVIPERSVKITRTLYEDDGRTQGYLDGESNTTTAELVKDGDEVRFLVASMVGSYTGSLETRNWILRFYLPQGKSVNQILINNSLIPIDDQIANDQIDYVCILPPADTTPNVPFLGRGSSTGSAGGDVIEVSISDYDVNSQLEIKWTLKQ